MVGAPAPEHFIYKGEDKVNPQALDYLEDVRRLSDQIATGRDILSRYQEMAKARLVSQG